MSLPPDGVIYSIDPFVAATVPAVGRATAARGGQLMWHRFSGIRDGSVTWDHRKTVGTGWGGLKQVFDGRGGIVYYVEPEVDATLSLNKASNTPASGGRLMWARHLGHEDGTFRWVGPRPVGVGWSRFKHVFSSGDGIIYAVEGNGQNSSVDRPPSAVTPSGKLLWQRHAGHDDGTFKWEERREIASGWGGYKHVFAGSDGVIYVVKANGDLVWHRHADQRRGAATLSPPKKVGTGWGIYEHVFYAGNGYIYGVEALQLSSTTTTGPGTGVSGGRLIRWRHVGMSDGSFEWEGPIVMDTFWSGSEFVFADGTDRAVNGHSLAQPHRFCEFKDPPGSPTLGPRSYGISGQTNIPRRMPLTWSIDANASVSNIPVGSPPLASTSTPAPATLWSIINRAFAIWSTPNPLSPSTGLALSFQYVNSDGDIVFDAKDLGGATATGGLTLGETEPRGNVIHFSNNPAVVFAPQVPPGGPPLAPNVSSLLSVATHEIGHALGLLHNTNSASMMTPLSSNAETLGADDIQSMRALYGWAPQRAVEGIGTDSSPVVCACGPWLVMAWKGIDPDDSIWTCRSTDGLTWTPQRVVPGTGTTDGPALAWDGNTLWLALRGIADDDAVYWATSSDLGDHWSGIAPVPGAGSANGPAMTIWKGSPLLVWRGVPGDTGLYFNFWQNGWTPGTHRIGGTGSTDRPSACVDFNGLPRIVWRGIEGDDALYTTVFTGTVQLPFWQPQEILQWIVVGNGGDGTTEIGVPGSLRGPSVTTLVRSASDREVLLLWRGVEDDQGIYFTMGAPGQAGAAPVDWSTQAQIPGVGTSDRPSITVFKGRIFIAWKGVEDDHTIWTAFN